MWVLTSLFRQHEVRLLFEWDQELNLLCSLVHQIPGVIQKKNDWSFPLIELTEQILQPVFDFLGAELHSWEMRSKGKSIISKSQKLVAWTWVHERTATPSSLSQLPLLRFTWLNMCVGRAAVLAFCHDILLWGLKGIKVVSTVPLPRGTVSIQPFKTWFTNTFCLLVSLRLPCVLGLQSTEVFINVMCSS